MGRGGSPNRLGAIEVNRPYLKEGIVDSMMICHAWYPCFEPTTHAGHRVAPDCYRIVAQRIWFRRSDHD